MILSRLFGGYTISSRNTATFCIAKKKKDGKSLGEKYVVEFGKYVSCTSATQMFNVSEELQ